tara:strand:- start:528 stop:1253 length:726 start_codon:yes stop_codon:yes gene_type:complete
LAITSYGSPNYSALALLNNALIMPLNYYMVIDSTVMTKPAWNLIPPAWSLGTELQAYLLLPFALKYRRFRIMIVVLSLIIYVAANLSFIHTDYFGYRLLPGVLFIFILGGSLKSRGITQSYWLSTTLFIASVILYISITYQPIPPQMYAQETLIGLMIGIPLLTAAHHLNIKVPYNRDMGSLSYGIFLTHFLIIWFIDYSVLVSSDGWVYYLTVFVLAAMVAKLGISLIDNRIDRHRIKKQ